MLMFSKKELTRIRDCAQNDMAQIQGKIDAICGPKFDHEGVQTIDYTPSEIVTLQKLYATMDARYESYESAQTLLVKYY